MKIFSLLIFLIVAQSSQGESVVKSPDGACSTFIKEGELGDRRLEIKRGGKSIFQTQSGYGGFTAMSWSPDSKYLAVVEHGVKTMMNVSVFFIEGDKVSVIALPDFRLNILGRYDQIKGGRYQFDNRLRWKEGGEIHFMTSGSLREGVSNPSDDPDNWYHFEVGIKLVGSEGTLTVVQPTVTNEKPWENVPDAKEAVE